MADIRKNHTPGPWLLYGRTIYALEHHGWRAGKEEFRNRFFVGVQGHQDTPESELEANARLIAASPDLLSACQTCFDALESAARENPSGPQAKALKQARSAIAKVYAA